jgi:uncharacterized C2H2 Zn-finger protein
MNFDKYKNNLPYPERVFLKCPGCGISFRENDKFCSQCGEDILSYYTGAKNAYNKLRDEYNVKNKELYEEFKKDALDEVGLSNHKNRDKIFDFAWKHGHSAGFYDVYFWLEELSELFED